MSTVVANESDIASLKEALATAGEEYKDNYARLESLIQEITNGDIKGNAADELVKKFNDKKDMLDTIQNSIDEANAYIEGKEQRFRSMMSGLMDNMK